MNVKTVTTVGTVVFCVILVSGGAGAPIPYPDLYGTTATEVDFFDISEVSATDPDVPLFGAPTRRGNRLSFTPPGFAASSTDGAGDNTSGSFIMSIAAPAGYALEKIIISEIGDYTLTGVGNAQTSAVVNGLLHLEDWDTGDWYDERLVVTPPGVATDGGKYTLPDYSSGSFTGRVEIDLTGLEITTVDFRFENNLQATSQGGENGTASYIEKKAIQDNVTLEVIIPEPATVCVLVVGVALLTRKRR